MTGKPPSAVGAILGNRYEILKKLGSGGMGEVYEARRIDLGDRVAVKILREEDREDPELRARFLREAQTLARVASPHVVRIVDFNAAPREVAFLAMEYLEGQSAGDLLRVRGPFSIRELGPLASQMFAGLAAVHAVGLVHRDIKPQNLMVVDGGPLGPVVKIVDFGLAKTTQAAPGEQPLTHHAGMLGTPSYMAPEQIGGNATIDARADVYGAAATILALATGKTLYDEHGDAVLSAILSGQRRTVREVAPELAPDLCAVLERALAADRNMRHARIEDLAAEVARAIGTIDSSGQATYASIPAMPIGNPSNMPLAPTAAPFGREGGGHRGGTLRTNPPAPTSVRPPSSIHETRPPNSGRGHTSPLMMAPWSQRAPAPLEGGMPPPSVARPSQPTFGPPPPQAPTYAPPPTGVHASGAMHATGPQPSRPQVLTRPPETPKATSSRTALVFGAALFATALVGIGLFVLFRIRAERNAAAPGPPTRPHSTTIATVTSRATVATNESPESSPSVARRAQSPKPGPTPSASPTGAPSTVPSGPQKPLGPDPTRTNTRCSTDAQCADNTFCDGSTGFCTCSRGTLSVNPGLSCGNTCVPQNRSHCGSCTSTCKPSEACEASNGTWLMSCRDCASKGPNFAVCGENCVDLKKSVTNCGQCGHMCITDPICRGKPCLCLQGSCVAR